MLNWQLIGINFRQQIEILKREIVDQEREYKSQIGALETKAHEHWVRISPFPISIQFTPQLYFNSIKKLQVVARQNERRLEELKAESGQLRNRLTLVEKNMNDTEPDVKLHRKYFSIPMIVSNLQFKINTDLTQLLTLSVKNFSPRTFCFSSKENCHDQFPV